MSMSSATKRQRRLLALAPAVALATAGVATGTSAAATAAPPPSPTTDGAAGEYYINYVEPRVENAVVPDVKVTKGANAKQVSKDAVERGAALDRKFAKGNPVAARGLAKLEAEAITTGKSPKSLKNRYKGATSTQEAKLLTILVEFNDEANDDFTDVWVPTSTGARAPACRVRSSTGRCTTTSRTPRTTRSSTTTRCGSRTSPRSTTTRCSTPTRASRTASGPT